MGSLNTTVSRIQHAATDCHLMQTPKFNSFLIRDSQFKYDMLLLTSCSNVDVFMISKGVHLHCTKSSALQSDYTAWAYAARGYISAVPLHSKG